ALLRLVTAHLLPPDTAAAIVSDVAHDREVSQVLAAFVQRLPDRLAAMDRACQGNDREELAALAHQLRGAASGYGFPAITAAAAALESAASTGRDVERRLAELADLCRRARAGAVDA